MSRSNACSPRCALRLTNDAATGKPVGDPILGFACALARQCFINEYVFATTAEEDAKVEELKRALAGASPSALQIAALAMYVPLHTLPALRICSNGNGLRTSMRCSRNKCASPRRNERCAI